MKNAYLIPRSHFPKKSDANSLLSILESSHAVVANKPIREEGKVVGALIVTKMPIPTEDLLALNMSAAVGEAYADQVMAAK